MLQRLLNILNFFVSLSAIVTLVWWHGYTYRPENHGNHLIYLHVCFGFYIAQFILRGWLSKNFKNYLKENRFEYVVFILMISSMLVNWWMDFSVSHWLLSFTGIGDSEHLFILYLHVWLLVIVGLELAKATARSTIWKLSPAMLLILSFIVLIVIGSSLLMLPEMTTNHKGMPFVDAMFTSTSANCVTGLVVVDTATYFTMKGKILLLVLIQLGGLNIISFATFFISKFHNVIIEKREDAVVREILHTGTLERHSTTSMLKKVLATTLLIEFIGALVLYNQWGSNAGFADNVDRIFSSVFHSVSAFNNAGFALFTDGFSNSQTIMNYPMHITIALLIILGGLGFTTLWDLTQIRSLFSRKVPRSPFRLGSKVAIFSSLILIIGGALLYWYWEKDNTLQGQNDWGAGVTATFQSITARTAGFNTADIGALSLSTVILIMVLMFIGASSGSTGGGIKTSTFSVLLFSVFERFKKKEKRRPSLLLTSDLVQKALAILLYSLITIVTGTAILCIFEMDKDFVDLLFEEISAFGTVGLTRGITPDLSTAGKVVVMLTIFVGRIGPLALAYKLIKRVTIHDDRADKGFMIG